VEIAYALPNDFNPINDFYFGCSSGGTKWTDSDRVFRQMSRNQWAIGLFADALGQLGSGDVPVFENMTRQLLQNAEGYAHPCTLRLKPASVATPITYRFTSAAGNGSGSFVVTGTVVKTGPLKVL